VPKKYTVIQNFFQFLLINNGPPTFVLLHGLRGNSQPAKRPHPLKINLHLWWRAIKKDPWARKGFNLQIRLITLYSSLLLSLF